MRKKELSEETAQSTKIVIALLSIIVIIMVGYVMTVAKSILLPFAIAVFTSYILYPIIGFFEKKRIPGFISVILTLIIFGLIFSGMIGLITESVNSFSKEFPRYEPRITQITTDVTEFLNLPAQDLTGSTDDEDKTIINKLLENFSIGKFVSSLVGSISNLFSNLFLIIIILLFMLMGRNQLAKKIDVAFDKSASEKISDMLININKQIQKYIVAKTLISLGTAVLVAIVLSVFGVEFVIIWAILTFVLNFIPSIGSIIASVLPLFIVFIQFDNPFMVLWIGICILAIQFAMGNIIEPKIMGKSINLSPLLILFSLIFWGWLWGIIGMFLSVPITVIIKIIFENINETKPLAVLMGEAKT